MPTASPVAPARIAYSTGNRLLDALPPADRIDLDADVHIVSLEAHSDTHAAGDVVGFVDFPIDAVLSVVATLENGDSIEVGTVGCEGFVETDVALDAHRAQRNSFCQVRGTVARMSIASFERRMATSESFARLMHRSVRAALFSAQQFAACNVKHSVLQRCARWLSMTEDRVGRPRFTLTHEFLAIMLGIRRASVSTAAHRLQTMGAITYRRGAVSVLQQSLLNETACECYAACKIAFASALSSRAM